MKNSYFLLFMFLFCCSKPEIAIHNMRALDISDIKITSVKKMDDVNYYTLNLSINPKEVVFSYDDNRDIAIGEAVKSVGIEDTEGTVSCSEKTLNLLYGKLKTISKKSNEEGLIRTTLNVIEKNGKCTIVTSDMHSTQEFERFIQSTLLKNQVKILMH